MGKRSFNYKLADAQGTAVQPIAPERFDYAAYRDYEAELLERNRAFWRSDAGVAVYRRFRVPECFSYGCRDMKLSLELQLGALARSMEYPADIANFLEPWYGIGTIASAFGVDYHWTPGQAPGMIAPFKTVAEALQRQPVPIAQTPIGRHTLEMIEYFLDKTGGRLPMSLTDTQSPMNAASFLVEINNFFMSVYDDPEGLSRLLSIMADLLIEFTKKQRELIGDALVWPGHGFASSREFSGIGMSDDCVVMFSDEQYLTFAAPAMVKVGEAFDGTVFHSCGNWSAKAEAIRSLGKLRMVDGAFSCQTDPDPNDAEAVAQAFAGTGIAVNARIVGDPATIEEQLAKLARPGMKLIVVTYCETPEEQAAAYARVHEMNPTVLSSCTNPNRQG
ncbi:hypothetical protein HS125_18100 [bacterium]|nr:hypothetical protein [bacterium]